MSQTRTSAFRKLSGAILSPVPTLLRSSFILQKSEAIYKFRLVNKSNIIQHGGTTVFHYLVFGRREQLILAIEHGVYFVSILKLTKTRRNKCSVSTISLLKNNKKKICSKTIHKLAYILHTFTFKTESDNPHYCLKEYLNKQSILRMKL